MRVFYFIYPSKLITMSTRFNKRTATVSSPQAATDRIDNLAEVLNIPERLRTVPYVNTCLYNCGFAIGRVLRDGQGSIDHSEVLNQVPEEHQAVHQAVAIAKKWKKSD